MTGRRCEAKGCHNVATVVEDFGSDDWHSYWCDDHKTEDSIPVAEYLARVASRTETVNHPAHYGGDTPYEVIKVLAEWMSRERMVGFCVGNAMTYLARADKKGNELEDWKKARWYINWLIEKYGGESCPKNST
jgi:hypothetical protein